MASNMLLKTFLLIIYMILIFSSSNSEGVHGLSLKEGLNGEPNPCGQRMRKLGKVILRKILEVEEEAILMDYNEPSANPSHEPRKGSPGGRLTFNP